MRLVLRWGSRQGKTKLVRSLDRRTAKTCCHFCDWLDERHVFWVLQAFKANTTTTSSSKSHTATNSSTSRTRLSSTACLSEQLVASFRHPVRSTNCTWPLTVTASSALSTSSDRQRLAPGGCDSTSAATASHLLAAHSCGCLAPPRAVSLCQ